jgi:protein phosphatase 1 regulatory subunit 7
VRGLKDLSCLDQFPKLKTLAIEDEKQLIGLHFRIEHPDLMDLKILNCKSLASVTGLQNLSSLQSIVIYQTSVEFKEFMKQKLPESLKSLGFYTTKSKIDSEIQAVLESMGYVCQ